MGAPMAAPARVLFVHSSERVAGGNQVLLDLIDRLPRQRFLPVSLVPRRGAMLDLLAARRVRAIVADPLVPGPPWARAARLARLALTLAGGRFDLVHADGPERYRGPGLLLPRAVGLCHLHLPAGPENSPAALRWAFRRPPRLLLACGEGVARSWRAPLRDAGLDLPCEVLLNGVDVARFAPGPPPAGLGTELGIAAGTPVVSLLASLNRRKGVEDLLAVAAHLPAARFLVAGEEIARERGYRDELERHALRVGLGGRVRFLGFRDDVVEILRLSDVVLLPSRSEGLPLALIEAAACGKPAVAYDIPGVDEVVRDGETGRLVPCGDIAALTQAVAELLAETGQRERLGEAARRTAVERFSSAAQAEHLVSIYDRVLASSRRA